jgi:hypothetical protein
MNGVTLWKKRVFLLHDDVAIAMEFAKWMNFSFLEGPKVFDGL